MALEVSPGDELYYVCTACKHACHVDVPEGLGLKPTYTVAPEPEPPTTPAARKAAYHLGRGLEIVRTASGWLVPSGTRAGVVHHVSRNGQCSCEGAAHGRSCWHREAVAQLGELREAA